ncbi:MAG TPA: phosphoribosylformylglycinamidine synthase subunit PurS [Candidatus Marinimicrobia bacterium]|nr:phosphoribosylformylglycinamidine synthase subunit PurS [Candidatus Neomarinimicrobiota bacterium]HOV23608.1 phosphoribosylformylglycinamidine synthase subunit PurS [Candidatus Neomarinimicrobiota bacterium]HPB00277.1 phosphoribosylformylglycinamidine synthase subunit PurS [Candidatus Neomarinimicrobiota bacterium]HQO73482.1 phosphoribosylformylglycinamidine synthase subunit PurS [Candidatus Neomarinimicrobiota bacterium]HRD18145.1 phosphoribosylformylglycinamidine synthase subunit PurS [Can
MWLAKVVVSYKEGILDPEAKTIQKALKTLGYQNIEELSVGKYFEIKLNSNLERSDVEKLVREICDRVLSNPVIQRYNYEIVETE